MTAERIALLEDMDRLAADPGVTLRAWQTAATPVAKLADRISAAISNADAGELETVASAVTRSVLVDPKQPVGSIVMMVDAAASRASPELRLGLLDLINALTCAGATLASNAHIAAWLPTLPKQLRVGFAGIVYGVLDLEIAPPHLAQFVGCLVFPGEPYKLLAYMISAARRGGTARALADAWRRVAEELTIDEPTLLWIARAFYQRFDGQPPGRVAELAHAYLASVDTDLHAARIEARTHRPGFPLRRTLGGGAFHVEQRLLGAGAQRLYRGREVATGAPLLVAVDDFHPKKQRIDELAMAVRDASPGGFQLAHVGMFDDSAEHWAIVERVTAGSWFPRARDPQRAIALGRSAGKILVDAGVALPHVRPELMWAEGDHVTGLSTRAIELFRRKRGELREQPLFDRYYHAPEIYGHPDDRAVAYSLAVMIAEWATGRYPFDSLHAPDGLETAEHVALAVPGSLRHLLDRTLRRDPADRPRLADFVAALDQL